MTARSCAYCHAEIELRDLAVEIVLLERRGGELVDGPTAFVHGLPAEVDRMDDDACRPTGRIGFLRDLL